MTKRDSLFVAVGAVLALLLHHLSTPHGVRVEPRPGTQLELMKTPTGWIVRDGEAVYEARDIRINAK